MVSLKVNLWLLAAGFPHLRSFDRGIFISFFTGSPVDRARLETNAPYCIQHKSLCPSNNLV